MQERAIHISSVDRQKIGKNKAEDFIFVVDNSGEVTPFD